MVHGSWTQEDICTGTGTASHTWTTNFHWLPEHTQRADATPTHRDQICAIAHEVLTVLQMQHCRVKLCEMCPAFKALNHSHTNNTALLKQGVLVERTSTLRPAPLNITRWHVPSLQNTLLMSRIRIIVC